MKAINKILATITVCAAFSMISQKVDAANLQEWYSVKKGDSYYSISKEFGIDISNFDVDKILKLNDKIEIPKYQLTEHVVENGDTIYSLAEENGIMQDWIYMANEMQEDDKLVLNSTIVIPVKVKMTNEEQSAETPQKVIQTQDSEQKVSTFDETGYVIQKGDTLMKICSNNGISLETILQWNKFIQNPNLILPGQKLIMNEKSQTTKEQMSEVKDSSSQKDVPKYDFSGLNSIIQNYKEKYPKMKVAMGIYDIASEEYIYKGNINIPISSACTVKAAYASYVLQVCSNSKIDIDECKIMYKSYMKNEGSGSIKDMNPDQEFSVRYLLAQLLQISDNTAYNILLSKFNLNDFQEYLNNIGGQNLNGCRYGTCTVNQRINEWRTINKYCNSSDPNGKVLKDLLASAKYSYLAQGFTQWHSYLHKSGWADGTSYNACGDAMIIDNYIIVVLSDDYEKCVAHTDVVRNIGTWCDNNLF